MIRVRFGMIGLGRMGANMARRLHAKGHRPVVFDIDAELVREMEREGVPGAYSYADLAAALEPPRVVWLMIPAAHVGGAVERIAEHLDDGDVVVDGGNSDYRDASDRAAWLESRNLRHVDVGVSGGIWGRDNGYCLTIGGQDEPVSYLDPLFSELAPGVEAAARTPGRNETPSTAEHGYLHCGPEGAGHFVKMVHNGIEYALMAAYAEGLAVLEQSSSSTGDRQGTEAGTERDGEGGNQLDVDTAAVAEVWRRGSVVRSWLLDLTASAMVGDPHLAGFPSTTSDSGEGRWTVQTAVDKGVPAHVITAALYERFSSRGNDAFAGRVLSGMRSQFGGHEERSA